jgi:glioma pathogenesis-related protein 2
MESNKILDKVNQLRETHQSTPVTLDPYLSQCAQEWAQTLASRSANLEHDDRLQFMGQGENLALIMSSSSEHQENLLISAINMWYSEHTQYDFSNPGFSPATGHFTALVWNDTDLIGWGIATSPSSNKTYISMRFSPAGNSLNKGQFNKNVKPQTSLSSSSSSCPVTTVVVKPDVPPLTSSSSSCPVTTVVVKPDVSTTSSKPQITPETELDSTDSDVDIEATDKKRASKHCVRAGRVQCPWCQKNIKLWT